MDYKGALSTCTCMSNVRGGERGGKVEAFFMPLLVGFPLEVTADFKAVGTDDEGPQRTCFSTSAPASNTFRKKGGHRCRHVHVHLTLSRLFRGIQRLRRGVMIYRETSRALFSLICVCVC